MENKNIVILIHAHKNIECLNKLIKSLVYDNFIIYVNLDKKSDINPQQIDSSAILVKKRVNVTWGEYSIVNQTLHSLQQIVDEQEDFSHVLLISGQDYPIKSNQYIDDFFKKYKEISFIECLLITESNKYKPYIWRYDRRHYPANRILERKIHTAYKLAYKFITGKEYKIKMIHNLTPYWGSQWWNLSKEAVYYSLEFAKNKKITTFFTTTWCSDEVFFQVLLMNSNLKDKIINKNFRYIDWTNCINSPRVLSEDDFNKIIDSDNLFCRKIDKDISDSLVEKLENRR